MPYNTTAHHNNQLLDTLGKLILDILESPCRNASWTVLEELRGLLEKAKEDMTVVKEQDSTEDLMAVFYIVFVLLFFATSLLIVLIKYLKREREETRLQNFYQDYLRRRLSRKVVRYDNEGRFLKKIDPTSLSKPRRHGPRLAPIIRSSVSFITPPDTPIVSNTLTTPIDDMPLGFGSLDSEY